MTITFGLVLSLFFVTCAGILAAWLTRELVSRHVISMDSPNERSLHAVATPRGGGLAIVTSIVLFGAAAVMWWQPEKTDFWTIGWMLGLTLTVAVFSFFGGDQHRLTAAQRFLLQGAVAGLWIWQTGSVFQVIKFPGIVAFDLEGLGWVVTWLFVVWTMNLFNFMDGMDGLAGAMVGVGCAVIAVIAYAAGHATLPLLAGIASASAFGFLMFNYPPASIFMGDVGSVSLGFFVAALVTLGARDGVSGPLTSGMAFAPFFVDATVTVVKRLLRGEKVWLAHRSHWYQRLVMAGWSHRRTLHLEIALMVVGGAGACLFAFRPERWVTVLAMWIVPYVLLTHLVRKVEHRSDAEDVTLANREIQHSFPPPNRVSAPPSRLQ